MSRIEDLVEQILKLDEDARRHRQLAAENYETRGDVSEMYDAWAEREEAEAERLKDELYQLSNERVIRDRAREMNLSEL